MIRSVSNHQKAITTLAFNVRSAVCVCVSHINSPCVCREQADGSRLISGSLDQHLKIYDVVDYSVVHTIKYNAPILCSALSVPLPLYSHCIARLVLIVCVCVCVCVVAHSPTTRTW